VVVTDLARIVECANRYAVFEQVRYGRPNMYLDTAGLGCISIGHNRFMVALYRCCYSKPNNSGVRIVILRNKYSKTDQESEHAVADIS